MSFPDPGCVKTPEAPKPREWLSEIAQIRPRSEIVIALVVIRGEISSINFPFRRVFTQPRPKPDSPENRRPIQTINLTITLQQPGIEES
jgi:hypothetical protein